MAIMILVQIIRYIRRLTTCLWERVRDLFGNTGCAEDGWDGGLLYVSTNGGAWNQAFVNYTNSTNWYDGTITSTSGFIGTNVGMEDSMVCRVNFHALAQQTFHG